MGKTTVYEKLKAYFEDYTNIKFFPERIRANPPVPFGSKNKQTAFRSEIHYNQQMIKRNELVRQFVENHSDHIAILDRTYLSTVIYTRALNLPKIDLELIEDTVKSVDWMKEHVIYLEAQPQTIMKRIYHRGSLDTSRMEWNEDDYQYLLDVMKKYNEIFREKRLTHKSKIKRIQTDEKSPDEVVQKIIKIIEKKTGMKLKNTIKVPKEQAKLTNWV